jgi:hypothetical protein
VANDVAFVVIFGGLDQDKGQALAHRRILGPKTAHNNTALRLLHSFYIEPRGQQWSVTSGQC